jgi:hypothetical protein
MTSMMETNVEPTSTLTDSLLAVNQLSYQMPPSLGIASSARHRMEFAQMNSYNVGSNGGASTIVFDLQSGSSFIDPAVSYFVFNVKHTSDDTKILMGFGSGSVANLIQTVTVRSRTGREICRVENFNLITKYADLIQNSQDRLLTVMAAQGYSPIGSVYGSSVPFTGKTFILPMSTIPCFAPINGKLLPPQLMEGLRIEFRLESSNIAFTPSTIAGVAPANFNYTITRPYAHYMCYDLADAFQRQIAMVAAKSGLRLLHNEYFHTITSANTQQVNYDIKKAASKALSCIVIPRLVTATTSANADCFASIQNQIISYQGQIGSQYYPNAPLTITDLSEDGNYESYYYSMYSASALGNRIPSITPQQWTGAGTAVLVGDRTVYNNNFVMFNLNTSNVSNLVGMTLNNSRAFLISLTTNTQISAGIRFDSYLSHLRATSVFTSNVTVLD